jgi:hypothetical protein
MTDSTQEKRLHPDWPVDSAPVEDLAQALIESGRSIDTVASVERYFVSYHGVQWTPANDDGGSELEMSVVGRLDSGEWIAVQAGNDYTGWGCQDFADVYVGTDEDDVVYNGLDKSGRECLGYPERTPGDRK